MKLMPGEDRRETGDECAERHQDHVRIRVDAAVGGVKRPARVHAAEHDRGHRQQPTRHENVPAREVQLGEREIAGADHHRQQKVAQHGRDRRDQKEEYHDHAMQRKELVVGLGNHEVAAGRHQLQPKQHGGRPADEEKQRDRDHEQDGNPLVVRREEPRAEAVIDVQVVAAIGRGNGHVRLRAIPRGGSDLIYAMSSSSCCSVNWP